MKMRMMVSCLWMLMAVAVAGVRAEAPAAVRAEDTPKVVEMKGYHLRAGDTVLFLGDSITAETKYFYKIFFEDIDKKYPELDRVDGAKIKYDGKVFKGGKLTFVNGGLSGDIAAGGLKRLPGLIEQWKPTVCVVCFGMNDRYKDRKGYVRNMKDIVEMLKKNNVAVTILTSPNVGSVKHAELKPFVAVLGEMAEEMKALAAEEKVAFADCYTPTKARGDDKGADVTWGDGIHPNETGHRIMADALQAVWGFGLPLVKEGEARPLPASPTVVGSATGGAGSGK